MQVGLFRKSTFKPRPYQARAVKDCWNAWKTGKKAVCLVSPTGSGKTVMGSLLAEGQRTLWIVHRNELIEQTQKKLPWATVLTVQKMLARPTLRPEADIVVFDEAHHYMAEKWRQIESHYSRVPQLGLTATPERSDGKSLGDMFDHMVVAAQYSELVKQGHIVPCYIYKPQYELGGDKYANSPVTLYQRHGEDRKGFVFAPTVENAVQLAADFTQAGIRTETITGKSTRGYRRCYLREFGEGRIRLLSNVYVLTEGLDVPDATVCILARNVQHTGAYMQMTGRVLRPSPGKRYAIIIDCVGSYYRHGSPVDDRLYSLNNDAPMKPASEPVPFKRCPECKYLCRKTMIKCENCGYKFSSFKQIKIYNQELIKVFAGANTPEQAKEGEWRRLKNLAMDNGWPLSWSILKYKELFNSGPRVSVADKRHEFRRLHGIAKRKGYKSGWINIKLREIFKDCK